MILEEIASYEPVIQKHPRCLYKGEYFIDLTTIETRIYDPVLEKPLQYIYNIGRISEADLYAPSVKKGTPSVSESVAKDFEKFCPVPHQQNCYLFNRVLDAEGKELPLFEGILYGGKYSGMADVNYPNRYKFIMAVENEMKDLVYRGTLDQSFSTFTFKPFLDFGDDIGEIIHYHYNPEDLIEYHGDDFLGTINGREYLKKFFFLDFSRHKIFSEQIKDCALQVYFREVVNSFYRYAEEEGIMKECNVCDSVFVFRKGKKYCSAKCLKSAANRKNYQVRKKGAE